MGSGASRVLLLQEDSLRKPRQGLPAKQDLDKSLQKASTDFVVTHFFPDAPVLIKHGPDPRLPLIVCLDPSLDHELSTKAQSEIRRNVRYPKYITVSIEGNLEIHFESKIPVYRLMRFEIDQVLESITQLAEHIPHIPDPPYCSSTTMTSITVQWSLPEPPGVARRAEIQYRIVHTPGGPYSKTSMKWQFLIVRKYDCPDFFSVSLEGISPGTQVQFRLAYSNIFGKSMFSAASEVMTSCPSCPSSPAPPTCTTLLPTCALLTWHAPNDNGSAIQSYQLRGRSAGAEEFTVLYTGSRLEFLVLYLFPDFSYSFEVNATNACGSSPYSHRLSLITPKIPRRSQLSSSTADIDSSIMRLSEERADVWLECFDQQLRRDFFFNRLTGSRQSEVPPALERVQSGITDAEELCEIEEKKRRTLLRQKHQALTSALRKSTSAQIQNGQEVFMLTVRRDHLLPDAFVGISSASLSDMRKKLRVNFFGEAGIDSGGLLREFYQLLSHEAISYATRRCGLFKEDSEGRFYFNGEYSNKSIHPPLEQTMLVNHDAMECIDNIELAGFIGLLAAKAFYDECMLEFSFSLQLVKAILEDTFDLDDIMAIDSDLHRSLSWMLQNDITGVIDDTFVVFDPKKQTFVDLCALGGTIDVTEENKARYVNLRVDWLLKFSIEEVLKSFLSNFWALIPSIHLHQCNINAFEMLAMMEGTNAIDVDKIRPYCIFQGDTDFNERHEAVVNFWCTLRSLSTGQLQKFLIFVTGCGRLPLDGFNPPFNITQGVGMQPDSLPKAHTCFNQIVLPAYSNPSILRERLIFAIENCSTFLLA